MKFSAIDPANFLEKAFHGFLLAIFLFLSFLLNVSSRFYYAVKTYLESIPIYELTKAQSLFYLGLYALLLLAFLLLPKFLKNTQYIRIYFLIALGSLLFSILGAFYSDVAFLYWASMSQLGYEGFIEGLSSYARQEALYYLGAIFLIAPISLIYRLLYRKTQNKKRNIKVHKNSSNHFKVICVVLVFLFPLIFIIPLNSIHLALIFKLTPIEYSGLPSLGKMILFSLYGLGSIGLLISAYLLRKKLRLNIHWLKILTKLVACIAVFTLFYEVAIVFLGHQHIQEVHHSINAIRAASQYLVKEITGYTPLFILLIAVSLFRQWLKLKAFDDSMDVEQTSGNFGTAAWASAKDLERMNAYDSSNGVLVGIDFNGRSLHFPIRNKLTISPEGGGKTTSSSIPILLSHDGPVFAFDTKGELWAVTARYRAEVLKREVVVIDPFDIVKSEDFTKGKPPALLKKYKFNPFDWVPEDKKKRDRMINTFAASFVINQKGYHSHFDDNAKILIRGYIDYLMKLEPKERTLEKLYYLMSESIDEAETTFEQMARSEGRAGAAANQISRVGADERGSILSTSYRQIDWLGDSNVQETLSESNFDLRDFLKGNMDIFVILPEDQVEEHNRLFRIIMSLLTSLINTAPPSQLPKQKVLFLIEELAQLGATPDVQKCIEVLRSRGICIWAVFQSLKQVKMFEKYDLFLSMRLKQIFANDDPETMKWIQELGGKKTILTKTVSKNMGDSRQATQVIGGTLSKGESESIHETGVDLIPFNEIRELPVGEQFIFVGSNRPIHCRQASYLEHPAFIDRFDLNPLECRRPTK